MDRRSLLRGLGAIGIGSMLPMRKALSKNELGDSGVCWLTPQETEGPYYLNANLVRQNITEGRPGLPLRMVITVINLDCVPIPNVLVDVWHADKDGNYSGFGGFVGQTFMRGIQPTDGSGVAVFDTVYPGWYPGRATHVHFKVRLTSSTYVTSQFCFLDSVNNAVYATPLYVGRGPNPTTNAMDMVFQSPDPQYLRMTATPNATGYDGTYTIGINAATDVKESGIEPGKYSLQQNYPNPFNPSTTIPYHLPLASDVKLIVYDVLGREMVTLVDGRQPAGLHEVVFDAGKFNSGFYVYKLIAGSFVQSREMLLLK